MARVLVVEDHADSREAISEMLKRSNFEVDSASNGRDALAFVIDRTPDVLLLDLAMPEMDGVKVIQVIRSYHRLAGIPVVILTGLSTGSLVDDAKALNVSSLLLKPMASFEQIRDAIERAISMPPSGARMQRLEKWRGDSISPL